MSPFVLIALAALLGFIVGWFAHGPKEAAPAPVAAAPVAPAGPNPLAAEVARLQHELASLTNSTAGLEAMVHGRDATIIALTKAQQHN